MFSFLKKKKKDVIAIADINKILIEILTNFNSGEKQNAIDAIEKGIIETVKDVKRTIRYDYYGLILNMTLVNEHQDLEQGQYSILGTRVWDLSNESYISIEVILMNGLVMGFALPKDTLSFEMDAKRVQARFLSRDSDENDTLSSLKNLLTNEEMSYLEGKQVYEIEIDDKKYYHLKELEDGNFIGIDSFGKLHKFTHDPYEIVPLSKSIKEIF